MLLVKRLYEAMSGILTERYVYIAGRSCHIVSVASTSVLKLDAECTMYATLIGFNDLR